MITTNLESGRLINALPNEVTGSSSSPPIGFLLRKLDNLIDSEFEATIGNHRVTRRDWQLLNVLTQPATLRGITNALAPFIGNGDPTEVQSALKSLIARGAVSEDGANYHLTDDGRELLEDLGREVRQTRDLLVRGLPAGEYDRTIGTLVAMIGNFAGRA